MNKLLAAAVAALVSLAALAQSTNAVGEVGKIDKAHGRITIKHEGVRNLDMPPMQLVFRLRDPAVLDTLTVGDKVRFAAEKVGGDYTVTAIVKVP